MRYNFDNESVKILIVDDNQAQAKLMAIAIEKAGIDCEMEVAHDGPSSVEKLSASDYSAVVLDYNLPGMNGLEVLEELKQKHIDASVIMVTGEGSEEIAVEAMKRGAYDYVIKRPGYLEIVPKALQKAIEKGNLARKLARSELRYQTLMEMASDAIFVEESETGNLLEVNAEAEELTRRSREELLSITSLELYEENDRQKIRKLYEKVMKKGNGSLTDIRMVRKNGKAVMVDVSASVVDFLDKKVIQSIVRDVTEKKKMEQQLLLSQRRLQSAFNGITDILTVVDNDLNIVIANKELAQKCDCTPDELIGRKCYQVIFNRDKPCEDCPTRETFDSSKRHFIEKERGEVIYYIWSYPMAGLDGTPEYVVEHIKDVTEQRYLEQRLIQSEKLATIGLLSSGIAHELRNPLNVIESARYYLEESLPGNKELLAKIDMIKRNIHRASGIINNLLEFSRRSDHDREEVDIRKLVESTVALLDKELSLRKIELEVDIPETPKIVCNLDSLKQVFLNIIINAVQAMPDGGRLQIRSKMPYDRSFFDVDFLDTGFGIPKENLSHVFSPFFTTKEVGEGTGLGLYISHSILKREGGDILVQSEEGVGSTFTVRLPVDSRRKL